MDNYSPPALLNSFWHLVRIQQDKSSHIATPHLVRLHIRVRPYGNEKLPVIVGTVYEVCTTITYPYRIEYRR